MSSTRPLPAPPPEAATEREEWPILRTRVPPSWKRWLEEAAQVRAMSVADLVRQCIRALMITRHEE